MVDKSHHWRAFAREFSATDEVRFEDFEGKREFDLGDYKRIKRGETAAGEQTANDEERVERQTNMQKQRDRWKRKAEEREQNLRRMWEDHLTQKAQEKQEERDARRVRLARLARMTKRRKDNEARQDRAQAQTSAFLTAVDDDHYSQRSGTPSERGARSPEKVIRQMSREKLQGDGDALEKYASRVRVPRLDPNKARSPRQVRQPGAKDNRRTAQAKGTAKEEAQMLAMLANAEARISQEEARAAEQAQDDDGVVPEPSTSLMPKKLQLRRAQLKLMKQLTTSMHVYRKHCAAQFARIQDLSELSYDDSDARVAAKVQNWSAVPTAAMKNFGPVRL
jgi:hypothetical protein